MIKTSLTKEKIEEISSRTLGSYVETDTSSIKPSDFITILPDNNFVDINYIVNLVQDLDYEELLYLRSVVEELLYLRNVFEELINK